jgi:hypothetical protein
MTLIITLFAVLIYLFIVSHAKFPSLQQLLYLTESLLALSLYSLTLRGALDRMMVDLTMI